MTANSDGPIFQIFSLIVQLAKYATSGRQRDAVLFLRKTYPVIQKQFPDLAEQLKPVLVGALQAGRRADSPVRAIPVDLDSRFELLKRDDSPFVDPAMKWPFEVMETLDSLVLERNQAQKLYEAGLSPTKSVLFTGPPGVGKTMAAKWLAQNLDRPLLTLDLAAVMSSFLGKTGNNLRAVLDYAREGNYVLLLDEFDAIAKRRDDSSDIGELKRLVTVLLQAVDEWPEGGLLIAATNHPELLDPAVWRRFERVVKFDIPSQSDIEYFIEYNLQRLGIETKEDDVKLLAELFYGNSYSDIDRIIRISNRKAILADENILDTLFSTISTNIQLDKNKKHALIDKLSRIGWSDRKISTAIRSSRDTIRNRRKLHDS